MSRFSGDQARQAVENDAEDRLIGGARRQVDLDLLFQFDDAGGDFDEAQPQSVELHDAPSRAFGHQPAHRPEEPVGTGVKEEAKLVGRSLMAGGAVGGERSEEHTSELQSQSNLVCRLLLEKKK